MYVGMCKPGLPTANKPIAYRQETMTDWVGVACQWATYSCVCICCV